MMNKLKLLLLMMILTGPMLRAQKLSVSSSIDSAQIWIGQQTNITFEYSFPKGKKIQTPVFSDTIVGGLELVQRLKPDTIETDNGVVSVKQVYTVTSFEDTLLLIKSFPFVDGPDTTWSDQLSLKIVQPFEIDTATQQITDVKDIYKPRYTLWYILKMVLPWVLGIILLAAIVYLIIILLRKKKEVVEINPELLLPAWEVALSKLEKIRNEKLWHQNRHKEYHTELTDVLRAYIERVFNVQAMEMTSDEILSHLNFLKKDNQQVYQALTQILKLADLVKFAKWSAGPDEHELSLTNALFFVNNTIPKEEIKEDVVS
jgi:hypothetical protein